MTARYCRHRRPRWRVLVPASAAVLTITLAVGMKAGALVTELGDRPRLVASASCQTEGDPR